MTTQGQPDDAGYADEAQIRAAVERCVDELKAAGAIGPTPVERAFRMCAARCI